MKTGSPVTYVMRAKPKLAKYIHALNDYTCNCKWNNGLVEEILIVSQKHVACLFRITVPYEI